MASKKVQLPVMGGLRKVVQVTNPASQAANPGTTITEFANQTVSLAQLKQALGIKTTASGNTSGGAAAALVPGQGLSGGGVLVGAVPIYLAAPIPVMLGEEGGQGEMGPPGQRGIDGVIGRDGTMGPPGDIGVEGPEGPVGPPGPPGTPGGPPGPTGATGPAGNDGAQGAMGLTGEQGEDGMMAIPGSQGPAGAIGPAGAAGLSIFGEDGIPGDMGPPGATGPAGTGGGGVTVLYGEPNFTVPPTSWTALGAAGPTITSVYSGKAQQIYIPFTSGVDSLLVQAVTPGTFTVTACLMLATWNPTSFSRVGVYWRDSSTGHMQLYAVDMRASPVPFASYNFSNLTTFNATIFSGQAPTGGAPQPLIGVPLWMRVVRDGSNNIKCFMSYDGLQFFQVGSTDTSNYVASPNQIGVGFSNAASSGTANDMSVTLYSWLVGP